MEQRGRCDAVTQAAEELAAVDVHIQLFPQTSRLPTSETH
jgi:hypothetical protein